MLAKLWWTGHVSNLVPDLVTRRVGESKKVEEAGLDRVFAATRRWQAALVLKRSAMR